MSFPAEHPKERYNISQAAALCALPPHTLRYWEAKTGLVKPARTASGRRIYSIRDIETIKQARDLVLIRGMTIEGARKILKPGRRTLWNRQPGLTRENIAVLTTVLDEITTIAKEC